jgi:glucose-6-phosphate isomerase
VSALVNSPAWRALVQHHADIKNQHMRTWFSDDPDRARHFAVAAAGLYLDYSKNRITAETIALLLDLARQAGVEQWRERMFAGEKINHTEERAVLHTALRDFAAQPLTLDGHDIRAEIRGERDKMRDFSAAVRDGVWRGYSGQSITDVVNIGIGGSDLGPKLACHALRPYAHPGIRVHFVANMDGCDLYDVLQQCRPETTLFIVSSKSFTTRETLGNALTARTWFLQQEGAQAGMHRHFVAVTANNAAATEFGIAADAQFKMWDWVGGRYSLWSAIGLPLAISIGMQRFEELLRGAQAMDRHFREAPLAENMPVILALLGVWYNNFFGYGSFAVLPYIQHLELLPAYLQQADMESNGKHVDRNGAAVDYQTGPILWGGIGSNAEHAFFQLLHQGTRPVPSDFILTRVSHSPYAEHQRKLLAHGIAQMEALMYGKTAQAAGQAPSRLAPYQSFEGNKPSNAIVMEKLTPATLGALLALYEHKIFVQGIVWNMNSYDQWGVEYGKQMASRVLQALDGRTDPDWSASSSTSSLIDRLR